MRIFVVAASSALAISLSALPTSAQVIVVEEEEVAETQIVEQGYVRGVGRGIQYGAHIISPVYVTEVLPANGRPLDVGAGAGLHARVGWEFPSGFTIEVLGGFAMNAVSLSAGDDARSDVFGRAEVGAGLRYMFFNDTAFVPYVQIGGSIRWFWFDWVDFGGTVQSTSADDPVGALHGAVGAQIELSPYFGIEAGVAVDYTFWGPIFGEGIVSVMPFLGVTLYVYDESGT